jgi:polyhydroxyalkanoic acid synthase PhaR subunit
MSEGTNAKSSLDPTELWKQWYDTSAKAWTNAVESSKELYSDPFGLYRSWSNSVNEAQNMLQGSQMGTIDITTIWQRWFEATMDIWRKASQTASDPLGITNKWLGMMEEAQAKLQKGEVPYTEPFTFFRDWYNATNETWSKFIEEYIGSEQFMETSTPFLESYASFFKTFRRANEEFFKNLQLPTRSDIARIAELVIALEEKVDQLDDSLDGLTVSQSKAATQEAVTSLAGQLYVLESKMDVLPATLAHAGAVENLNQRLDSVEGKVDALPATLSQQQAVEGLNHRLDGVEGKLDALPITLSQQQAVESLNQRLDGVEGKLDNLPATLSQNQAVENLNHRLDGVEGKLDALPATLSQQQAVESLNERLERVESKLDALPTALQQQNSVDTLAQRLDRLDTVENKLDRLLKAVEKPSTKGSANTSKTGGTAGTAPHKTQKKTANRQSVNKVNTTADSE